MLKGLSPMREEREVMKSRFSVVKRAAGVLLSAGFLFVLVGDRAMTATPLGIDPLEVLNLQIKPNVLIVLDTSGSMNQTAERQLPSAGTTPTRRLDRPSASSERPS